MIYIFVFGLFINLVFLTSWLFASNWKFSSDDFLIIAFAAFNSFGFALAIRISI